MLGFTSPQVSLSKEETKELRDKISRILSGNLNDNDKKEICEIEKRRSKSPYIAVWDKPKLS